MIKFYNVYFSNLTHVLNNCNSFEKLNNLVEVFSSINKEDAEEWVQANSPNENTTVFIIEVYKLDKTT